MSEWIVKQRIQIPFRYTTGRALTRFLEGLQERRIWASHCDSCDRVTVPPLSFCGRCWRKIENWRELPAEGELLSYTFTEIPLPELPDRSPIIFGLIRLDGADSHLVHLIDEVDPSELANVTRVRAVWRGERRGSILDISHFAPATETSRNERPGIGHQFLSPS